MGQVLHGGATTTEAVRRAIQARQESVRARARRFGISPTTVQKRPTSARQVDFVGNLAAETIRVIGVITTIAPAAFERVGYILVATASVPALLVISCRRET